MSKIEFKNVKKVYGEKTVVNDINLTIDEGDFVTIIGSSGSGKTTLLKMINNLVNPTEGSVFVSNHDVSASDKIALRRSIGYVVQGSVLFPHLNVEENINFVPNLKNDKSAIDIKGLLEMVDLDESYLKRMPNELSGGEAQRVGLIRALCSYPNILLMDEPFGAVDEITKEQLQDEIKKIHQQLNLTIIFITHDIREAIFLATKVVVMNEGHIEQMDSPDEIIKNPKTEFVKKLTRRIR